MNREEMILSCMSQVRIIAQQIRRRLSVDLPLEDLVSIGTIGLIKAVDNFDPSRGWKLRTFTEYRIRGEIQDWMRREDTMPRSTRLLEKRIKMAAEDLSVMLGRQPSNEELAMAVGAEVDAITEHFSVVPTGPVVVIRTKEGTVSEILQISEATQFESVEAGQRCAALKAAMRRLPKHSREALRLRFWKDMPYSKMAERCGVNESAMWHRVNTACQQLREQLKGTGAGKD